MGELHIVEETACWERKFMLFKVYSRQSVGMSSRPNFAQSGVLLHIIMGTGPLRRCWRILFAIKGTEPAVKCIFLSAFLLHSCRRSFQSCKCNILPAGCPSCHPTNSVKAPKEWTIVYTQTLTRLSTKTTTHHLGTAGLCYSKSSMFTVCLPSMLPSTNEKSAKRRRKRCVLAVVRRSQKFSPRHRPPSLERGTAKI